MYVGRINSHQLNRYLDFLLSNGLLEETTSRRSAPIYQVTPHGEKALAKLQEIIDMLGVDDNVDA